MVQKIKKITRKIHLWIAFLCGIIVFIVAVTGSIYVFQEELQGLTQPYRFVQVQDKPFLLPSQLEAIAIQKLPKKFFKSINYGSPTDAARILFRNRRNPVMNKVMYINPYDGTILKEVDMGTGFFRFILRGHLVLWLPPFVGKPIVGIAVILFFFMVITGLILWLPKNIKQLKQNIWFRWTSNTRWKRKNYDLHNILGFFSATIAITFIITGLVWKYDWFREGYYSALGGDSNKLQRKEIFSTPIKINDPVNPIDKIYLQTRKANTQAYIDVQFPQKDSAVIIISTNTELAPHSWKKDYRYYDQYSLQEIKVNQIQGRLADADLADKIMRMNYDIHTGSLLGLSGKILTCIMSLIIASLPITGFYIWWGRKKSNNKKFL